MTTEPLTPHDPAGDLAAPQRSTSTRSQQRITETKQAIIECANRLFDQQGFDATTMTQIAAAANVPRRSLFRYFPTKEDIVFAAIDREEGALMRSLLAAGDRRLPAVERLKTAFRGLVAQEESNADTVRRRVRLILDKPTLAMRLQYELSLWQKDFEILLAAGNQELTDNGLRRKVQVAAVFSAYVLAVTVWVADSSRSLSAYFEVALSSLNDFAAGPTAP